MTGYALGTSVLPCDREEGQTDSAVPCLEGVISPFTGERSQERPIPHRTRTSWGRELSLRLCRGQFQGLQEHTKEGFPHIATFMGKGILLGKTTPTLS